MFNMAWKQRHAHEKRSWDVVDMDGNLYPIVDTTLQTKASVDNAPRRRRRGGLLSKQP